MNFLLRYARWLHTRWPAGHVEKLPDVGDDGRTNVPGLYVAGDLTGVPLLKFAAQSGAAVVRAIQADPDFHAARARKPKGTLDLVIVGGGVSGMAAALEARKLHLDFVLLEAAEPFSTLVNFPKGKPIYTYPADMTPQADLQFTAQVKEPLLDELRTQTLAKGIKARAGRVERVRRARGALVCEVADQTPLDTLRVVVAIGRSGNFRRLGVPGEELDKVSNRLHDPKDYCQQDVLVVGGGDSALETAVALAQCGARVTLSYRKRDLSRPKPENIANLERLRTDPMAEVTPTEPLGDRVTTPAGPFLDPVRAAGSVRLELGSRVARIDRDSVTLELDGGETATRSNDAVFAMIGREAPLEFFRRSGVRIRGEWRWQTWVGLLAFLTFCVFVYNWKASGDLKAAFKARHWFPFDIGSPDDAGSWSGTLLLSMHEPGFWYSLAYSVLILAFGLRRMARRKTPYVKVQTWSLIAFQWLPLFLLPYLLLPWLGHNGAFDSGAGAWLADQLFPKADYDPHGREYWRAFGLILAWPLFIWNVFSSQPMWLWLAISLVQTCVLIPLLVRRFGKGAYCGWICSCGAMAETLGDAHRHKMPHGKVWNRLNLVGQVILAAALVLLFLRVVSWTAPNSWLGSHASAWFYGLLSGYQLGGVRLNYYWLVDVGLAGILGLAFYFHFSGRVWCRFACPLAALMHVYARFSRFRILADKKKCISCNVCTSVCHQGIDIMNFANKGLPMADPECVRCSACVQTCPTGVLEFGALRRDGTSERDRLAAK
ncbi:MAG: NAD(P)-binding domain-containing protein [Planctomycetota bacterium]